MSEDIIDSQDFQNWLDDQIPEDITAINNMIERIKTNPSSVNDATRLQGIESGTEKYEIVVNGFTIRWRVWEGNCIIEEVE